MPAHTAPAPRRQMSRPTLLAARTLIRVRHLWSAVSTILTAMAWMVSLIPAWAPVHWAQIFVEHLVAFSALGYAGIFGNDKKWKVLCGVLLAILLRFIGQMLSGVVFFSQNAWDGWGAWGYSITYHLSCKIPEGTATTLIMLALPLKTIQNAIGGKQS